MCELIYCSMETREILEADILDLLKVALNKNVRLEVTGLLVYKNGRMSFCGL